METAKTLSEMNFRERYDLMAVVAAALEARADAERDAGDLRYAENFYNLALTIRGSAEELASSNLQAAELLLQQAIALVGQSLPGEKPTLH